MDEQNQSGGTDEVIAPKADQHLMSLVAHAILHFVAERGAPEITLKNFDPRDPRHQAFAVDNFAQVVQFIGDNLDEIKANAVSQAMAYVVPGNDSVN